MRAANLSVNWRNSINSFKYIELEGANHFFGTFYYRHSIEMYPAMIDWLDNTCGLKRTADLHASPPAQEEESEQEAG